jgi:hypothetical protein
MAKMSIARRRIRRKREDKISKGTQAKTAQKEFDSTALSRQIQHSMPESAAGKAALQARLIIGKANDVQEVEADKVADSVVASPTDTPALQQKKSVQKKADEEKEPEQVQTRLQRQPQEEEEEVQASLQSNAARSFASSASSADTF